MTSRLRVCVHFCSCASLPVLVCCIGHGRTAGAKHRQVGHRGTHRVFLIFAPIRFFRTDKRGTARFLDPVMYFLRGQCDNKNMMGERTGRGKNLVSLPLMPVGNFFFQKHMLTEIRGEPHVMHFRQPPLIPSLSLQ